jgi:hypothetical protein
VQQDEADGEEGHAPQGEHIAVHPHDEIRSEEPDRQGQQQGSEEQGLEHDDADCERQPGLEWREPARDEKGQPSQDDGDRGGDRTGPATKRSPG